MDNGLKVTITLLQPAFDASLDALAIVDLDGRVRHANVQMRALLGITVRELKSAPVFCECLRLAACSPKCEINKVLETGKRVRIDETPAHRGAQKIRATVSVSPLYYPGNEMKNTKPIGAIISARETTGEILLQAKYHRAMLMLQEREQQVALLTQKLKGKEESLRRARG